MTEMLKPDDEIWVSLPSRLIPDKSIVVLEVNSGVVTRAGVMLKGIPGVEKALILNANNTVEYVEEGGYLMWRTTYRELSGIVDRVSTPR